MHLHIGIAPAAQTLTPTVFVNSTVGAVVCTVAIDTSLCLQFDHNNFAKMQPAKVNEIRNLGGRSLFFEHFFVFPASAGKATQNYAMRSHKIRVP